MSTPPRKKVLFLITKSNWGGAQRYVYDLATALDKNTFEPVVALGGTGVLIELLTHAGIRVITIETLDRDISTKKEWEFIKELWQILKTERPDILHVNSSKAGAIGTLLGRIAGIPRVLFTAHGWAFNEDRPLWQRLIIKTIHWITVLFSHKTIAVSSAIVAQMDWPLASKKLKVLNPGRTIGVMYEKTEAREKIVDFFPSLRAHSGKPWIITVAELHPIKRLNVLIDAMNLVSIRIPEAVSVIIGGGELRAALESQIKATDLTDRVFLTGPITEAARFLKAADVFVLPSKSESYGYVLHEAGLALVPIVATNVGGITDIISSKAEGLLVVADDTEALAQAITATLLDAEAAKERAEMLYRKLKLRTTAHMVTATSALYTLPLK